MTHAFAAAAVLVGGALLFALQTIAGRLLLPRFGGGPSVWTICLVFFQTGLLGGYLYAYLVSRLRGRTQIAVHGAAIAAAALALWRGAQPENWAVTPEAAGPEWQVVILLAALVGLPYLLVASTSPLVQHWRSGGGEGTYRLYAWSNLGSLIGLPGYLVLIEPFFTLRQQLAGWAIGFVVWAVAVLMVAREAAPAEVEPAHGSLRWTRVAQWFALSAAGSALLVATTNQLCQEVFPAPLLWILPLSLYLATFIWAFGSRPPNPARWAILAAVMGAVACTTVIAGATAPIWLQVAIYSGALFAGCTCVHGELAQTKPAASRLTEFYLIVSAGGAVGGMAVALAAPRVFHNYSEYYLAVGGCAIAGLAGRFRQQVAGGNPLAAMAPRAAAAMVVAVVVTAISPGQSQEKLDERRNFFGTLSVAPDVRGERKIRKLVHGRILHGMQFVDEELRRQPTTYFGHPSAIGLVAGRAERGPLRIGVIGLGAGTIAAHGRAGDTIRFYEINPDVEEVARRYFTYLSDSKAATAVVLGDARVSLEQEAARGEPGRFDVFVLDAFSSGSIPAHLLTRESFDLYRRHLAPGGMMLFHVSNHFLDLAPVVRGLAREKGLDTVRIEAAEDVSRGLSQSTWLVVGPGDAVKGLRGAADPFGASDRTPIVWSDDFHSLLSVVRRR